MTENDLVTCVNFRPMEPKMTPLYNHTSPETAYLVDDYPYGRTLRCKIRYWLEYKPSKGYRLGSQTTNPKAGHTWNKPKYSTYTEIAACMYLDENNHVTWHGVGVYTDVEKTAGFVAMFPTPAFPELLAWCHKKAVFSRALATGQAGFTINGKLQERSAHDIERDSAEADKWNAIAVELARRVK